MPQSKTAAWISAMRLRTLPLAASCVLVGSALGWNESEQPWLIFILALLTAWLLQVLSNLANDYGDYVHGADNKNRIGPQRALQGNVISKDEMFRAIVICAVLAFVTGVALLYVGLYSLGYRIESFVLLLMGLASIGAAYKYTAGKNPYGYRGWGDVFVFLFFGIVGVCGTAFLYAGHFDLTWLMPASSIGFFATSVLNLNNMRDHVNDKASGKKTLVVMMGFHRAKWYHYFLISMGWFFVALFFATNQEREFSWWIMLPSLVMVLHLSKVMHCSNPAVLDPELKKIALSTFIFALLFFLAVGLDVL